MASGRVKQVLDATERMKARRARREARWSQIQTYIIPMSSALHGPGDSDINRGAIVDNTGEQAHERLAAALVAINTPSVMDWFRVRFASRGLAEDHAANLWLEEASATALAVFRDPNAGFAACQHEKYQDLTGFGLGGSCILDVPGKGIQFSSVPLRQLLIGEDGFGNVDTVHRDFTYTAAQAWRRWGRAAGGKVAEAAQDPKKSDKEFRFVHAVWPNPAMQGGMQAAGRRPFLSSTVNADEEHEVEWGGFYTMPYQTPRWRKRAGEEWGRGCGDVALADVKMLQRAATSTILSAELAIRPPWMVADDGVLGPVRIGQNRINYVRRDAFSQGDPIKALLSGSRPEIGEEMMIGIRARIDGAFFRSLIEMVRKDRMTATEVLEVKAEAQRVLGPYLGRSQDEDIGPMILRVADILERAGALPPRPPQAMGVPLRAEMIGPEAQAQRLAQARGLAQLAEITAPLTQVKPDLFDNLDADLAFRETGEILGNPKRWFRAPETVQQIRAARADAQAAEAERVATNEAIQTGATAAGALAKVSQSLSSPTESLGP